MPIETIQDHRIKIKPTKKLVDFLIKNINKNVNDVPENLKTLKNKSNRNSVDCVLTLNDIKWLKTFLTKNFSGADKNIYIHELLENIDIQLPQPVVTPRSSELEARIKKLRARQNDMAYKAMTKSVDSSRKFSPDDSLAYQSKFRKNKKSLYTSFKNNLI